MAVIAGTNLEITKNDTEGSDGKVTLKSTMKMSAESFLLIFEYNNTGAGETDTGFTIQPSQLFDQSVLLNKEIQIQILYNTLTLQPQTYIVDTVGVYNAVLEIQTKVPKSNVVLNFQWTGAFTTLSDLTLHLIPNSSSVAY